jgi:hypothetical protein
MKRFTNAIAKAVTDKNWLAATALALTMPDICGRMEHPKHGSEKRYKAWWDKYLLDAYRGSGNKIFLGGADAYALRCAYVHEGGGKTLNQRAREVLTHFHFVVPSAAYSVHNCVITHDPDPNAWPIIEDIEKLGGATSLRQIADALKARGFNSSFTLILQVDRFCRDMIDGVDRWSNDVASNQAVQQRLQSLLEIHEITPNLLRRLGMGWA